MKDTTTTACWFLKLQIGVVFGMLKALLIVWLSLVTSFLHYMKVIKARIEYLFNIVLLFWVLIILWNRFSKVTQLYPVLFFHQKPCKKSWPGWKLWVDVYVCDKCTRKVFEQKQIQTPTVLSNFHKNSWQISNKGQTKPFPVNSVFLLNSDLSNWECLVKESLLIF